MPIMLGRRIDPVRTQNARPASTASASTLRRTSRKIAAPIIASARATTYALSNVAAKPVPRYWNSLYFVPKPESFHAGRGITASNSSAQMPAARPPAGTAPAPFDGGCELARPASDARSAVIPTIAAPIPSTLPTNASARGESPEPMVSGTAKMFQPTNPAAPTKSANRAGRERLKMHTIAGTSSPTITSTSKTLLPVAVDEENTFTSPPFSVYSTSRMSASSMITAIAAPTIPSHCGASVSAPAGGGGGGGVAGVGGGATGGGSDAGGGGGGGR